MPARHESTSVRTARGGRHSNLTPRGVVDLDAVLPGGSLDALPCRVAFSVADAADLVETRDGIADMARVSERLFPLSRKRKLRIAERISFLRRQCCHRGLRWVPEGGATASAARKHAAPEIIEAVT